MFDDLTGCKTCFYPSTIDSDPRREIPHFRSGGSQISGVIRRRRREAVENDNRGAVYWDDFPAAELLMFQLIYASGGNIP